MTPFRSRQLLAPGHVWGREPIRGVNLGGWLVLEPWITPSLFSNKPDWVVDEWSYGVFVQNEDPNMSELRAHWESWIQSKHGQDTNRLYPSDTEKAYIDWSLIPLIGEPYLPGAFEYLQLAVTWARSLNLKVMLDLHGAPGSQNSFDNSGLRDRKEWYTNSTNSARTTRALRVLVNEFSKADYGDTVAAVQVLNEPFPWNEAELATLRSFYSSAYFAIRESSPIVVGLDSAFQDLHTWESFMTEPSYKSVALDTHIYSMFNNYTLVLGYEDNLRWYCSQATRLREANLHHWTIVGEFTPAHTDCARWLNGRGRGARWENELAGAYPLAFPGDCTRKTGKNPTAWDEDYLEHLGRSFETQTWVYEQASGWIQWTWKTEEALDWSMKAGITYGWIPTPIWNKTHG